MKIFRATLLTCAIAVPAASQTIDQATDDYMREVRAALRVLILTPDPNWSSRCAERLAKYEELLGLAESPLNRQNRNNVENMALGVLMKAAEVCRIEAQSYCNVATAPEAKEACAGLDAPDNGDKNWEDEPSTRN